MIKRLFLTGLAVLLPVVITVMIVTFFLNLLTRPFQDAVENILHQAGVHIKPFLFLTSDQVLALLSKVLVLISIIALTLLTGFLAQMVFANYFIRLSDYVLHRIPIVRRVYKGAQDTVKSLLADDKQAFSQVALVPFPHTKAYSIALVCQQGKQQAENDEEDPLITVFVPATPNPTAGFILLVKKSQVLLTTMNVEEALKIILSCGVVLPQNFNLSKG